MRHILRPLIATSALAAVTLSLAGAVAAADPVPDGLGAYLAGRQAERDKQSETAAQYLARAFDANKASDRLLNQTFVALVMAGEFEAAGPLAAEIVKRKPDQGPANFMLSVVAVKKGDFKTAQLHVDKLRDTGVNRLMKPVILAWIAAGRGDKEAALAALKPIEDQRGFRPFYDLHKALILDVLKDTDGAKAAYDAALKATLLPSTRLVMAAASFRTRNDDPQGALKLLKDFYRENKAAYNVKLAIDRIEAGRTLPPIVASATDGYGEFLSNLAVALQQEAYGRQAIFYARMSQLLRPDNAATLYSLGNILQEDGRHADAIRAYEKAPKEALLSWAARQSMAVSLITIKRDDEAAALIERMAKERPDAWRILQLLGNMYRARSEYEKALQAYERAVKRVPKIEAQHWNLLYVRGIAYERTKRWPQAEADLKKALSFRPNDPSLLNYLAYSWVERGEHLKQAEEMLVRAVRERPEDGFIIDSLGWVLYRLGRFQEAVVQLERAVAEEPADPTLNDHLGDCYWRLGRHDEARFQWQRALSLDPEKDQIAKIKDKLKNGMPPFKPVVEKDKAGQDGPDKDGPKKDGPKKGPAEKDPPRKDGTE